MRAQVGLTGRQKSQQRGAQHCGVMGLQARLEFVPVYFGQDWYGLVDLKRSQCNYRRSLPATFFL